VAHKPGIEPGLSDPKSNALLTKPSHFLRLFIVFYMDSIINFVSRMLHGLPHREGNYEFTLCNFAIQIQ